MSKPRTAETECPVCRGSVSGVIRIKSAVPYGADFEDRTHADDALHYKCDQCGEFVVNESDQVNLRSERLRVGWNQRQLSALLREQTIWRLPPVWLRFGMDPYGPLDTTTPLTPINLEELLRRWPRTVPERINRTLINIGKLSSFGGDRVSISDTDYAIAFAENVGEAIFNRRALIETQLIANFGRESGAQTMEVWLTPKGWERYFELTAGKGAPENPVFVAMWYGEPNDKQDMDQLFHEGIEAAINDSGYRATRTDLEQHNDWIMDQVLGDIRLSPFVVADFTGHRNGVYFEAGFARGLGTTVINTCRKDEWDKAHFDTKQLNHILWESPQDLQKALYHRIRATIGEGPFKNAQSV